MKKSYRLSKKAIADLESIWKYTFDKWSAEQADRYYRLIIDEIEFIAGHLLAGESIDQIRNGYRKHRIQSHLIFYREAEDGVVEVIRILHERMDIKNRFGE